MADRTLVGPALRPECSRNASHIQRLAAPPRQVGAPAYRPRRSAQRPQVDPALLDSTLIALSPRSRQLRLLCPHHYQIPQSRAPAESTYLLVAYLGGPAWRPSSLGG